MKRNSPQLIGDLLPSFFAEQGLQGPLNEYRLVKAWSTVAGERVAKATKQVYIRGGKLFVSLNSPALRHTLVLRRSELVRQLNTAVDAQVITDICFI